MAIAQINKLGEYEIFMKFDSLKEAEKNKESIKSTLSNVLNRERSEGKSDRSISSVTIEEKESNHFIVKTVIKDN